MRHELMLVDGGWREGLLHTSLLVSQMDEQLHSGGAVVLLL